MTGERKTTTITFVPRQIGDTTWFSPRPYELAEGDDLDIETGWATVHRDGDHVVSFPAHTIALIATG